MSENQPQKGKIKQEHKGHTKSLVVSYSQPRIEPQVLYLQFMQIQMHLLAYVNDMQMVVRISKNRKR